MVKLKESNLLTVNRRIAIVVLFIFLGAFLRFYNLADVVFFEYDEQYNSYLVYNLVKNHHLSLVGQETSFGGMFLGPWQYLYLTPFYILTNLHPIGGYIGEITIGLWLIFSYYWIGSRLFSVKVGLLVALLRAVLFSFIGFDRIISPAYPSEFTIVWFLYFLARLYQRFTKSFLFLSFLSGMMFTVHLVALPLILVWLLMMIVYRPIKLTFRLILKSLIAFLIPVMPVLIFEIRHDFQHVLRFIQTLSSGEGGYISLSDKFTYEFKWSLSNFYSLFDNSVLSESSRLMAGVTTFGGIIYMLYRKKGQFQYPFHRFLFSITFITVIIYYLIYPRHVPEYYFMILTSLTLLYVGALLVEISQYFLGKIVFSSFLVFILITNLLLWHESLVKVTKFNLSQKDQVVKTIVEHQKGKGDFSVSYFMEFGRNYGFQYFFTLYGLTPREKITPPIYSIVIPKDRVAEKDLSASFGDIGVIFPEQEPEQGK